MDGVFSFLVSSIFLTVTPFLYLAEMRNSGADRASRRSADPIPRRHRGEAGKETGTILIIHRTSNLIYINLGVSTSFVNSIPFQKTSRTPEDNDRMR
jgi:hypothetical protein